MEKQIDDVGDCGKADYSTDNSTKHEVDDDGLLEESGDSEDNGMDINVAADETAGTTTLGAITVEEYLHTHISGDSCILLCVGTTQGYGEMIPAPLGVTADGTSALGSVPP